MISRAFDITTVKPLLKGHFRTGDILKRGSIHIKFSITGQEKGDLLIPVTAWAGLTVYALKIIFASIQN